MNREAFINQLGLVAKPTASAALLEYRKLYQTDISKFKNIADLDSYINRLRYYNQLLSFSSDSQLYKIGFYNQEHMQDVLAILLLKAAKKRQELWSKTHLVKGEQALFGLGKSPNRFSPVREIDRSQIITEPGTFQGREGKFAEETVNKIVSEGFDKTQDPIIVWEDKPKKKFIVISGHSRFEASEILFKKGQKDLAKMPVKMFLGTKEEAQEYALLESNRSGTAESLKSDIKAFIIAKKKGYNRQKLLNLFKPESKLRLLQDLAELNPKGKFIEHLGEDSEVHFPYLKRNAQWVGNIRRNLPDLENSHEAEMFDYLYKSTKGLAITKDRFFDLINKTVSKIDFSYGKPLNLNDVASSNALTDPLKEEIADLQREIDKLQRKINAKRESLVKAKGQKLTDIANNLQKEIADTETIIQRKLIEIDKLKQSMSRLENETAFDLFSLPEMEVPKPEPKPAPENEKRIRIALAKAKAIKIKLSLIVKKKTKISSEKNQCNNECYIEFLNKDKNFSKDKKIFKGPKAYVNAANWGKKNLEKFSLDMIN